MDESQIAACDQTAGQDGLKRHQSSRLPKLEQSRVQRQKAAHQARRTKHQTTAVDMVTRIGRTATTAKAPNAPAAPAPSALMHWKWNYLASHQAINLHIIRRGHWLPGNSDNIIRSTTDEVGSLKTIWCIGGSGWAHLSRHKNVHYCIIYCIVLTSCSFVA